MESNNDLQPSQQQLAFPKRPHISSTFKAKSIDLITNHLTLSLSRNQSAIYVYDVKILDTDTDEEIPLDARTQVQRIFRAASPNIKEVFGGNFKYSGQLLWSIKNHTSPKTIQTSLSSGGRKFSLVFTKTRETNLKADNFQDERKSGCVLQFVNILIKSYFKERNYVEWGVNAKFYDPNPIQVPEYYLDIFTGFKTSCQVYKDYTPKILIDFSSKILRSDSALYYIDKARSEQEAREMLQGKSVVASYGNYRMWRITDIDFSSNPKKMVEVNDKVTKRVSLAEYYQNKYGITIQNLNQPLLVSVDRRTNKTSLLVPELVQMTGLDDEMRRDYKLMNKVAQHTRLDPSQRMTKINSLACPLGSFLSNEYGITMDQTSSVKGFVLEPPKLLFGKGATVIPDRGNYIFKDHAFRPAKFEKWLFVTADACQNEADLCIETLKGCSKNFGIVVKEPVRCLVKENSRSETVKEAIKKKLTDDIQIVVVMLTPRVKNEWYKATKDVCSKEKGVQSQCIVSSSLRKNPDAVCSKLLLQMNVKIGQELWITQRPQGLPERTMLIGADVYHSTKIGQERKSCIGFCATLNAEFSKYYSKVSYQERIGKEIMDNIGKLVKEAVLRYLNFNKFLPDYIIFFRDGVGENQLKAVLERETMGIIEQLKLADPNHNFKFAEVIVTKRIDDRIFSTGTPSHNQTSQRPSGRYPEREQTRSFYNPPAGTIVADSVVSNNFDYLLVSQNVTQGTCTPTHYNVIYDTTGLPQDLFWQLSYSQCYNYFNWNGGVRVPAPAQYAHKLAYLAGQTLRGNPDKKLDETLYYL